MRRHPAAADHRLVVDLQRAPVAATQPDSLRAAAAGTAFSRACTRSARSTWPAGVSKRYRSSCSRSRRAMSIAPGSRYISIYCRLQTIKRRSLSNMLSPCGMLLSAASKRRFCSESCCLTTSRSVMSSCVATQPLVRHRPVADQDRPPVHEFDERIVRRVELGDLCPPARHIPAPLPSSARCPRGYRSVDDLAEAWCRARPAAINPYMSR